MAAGKTHDWITLALLGPVFWLVADPLNWGLATAAWVTVGTAAGGLLLSPDLDTPSRPFYRWGWLRMIWWPYQWCIRHRSSLSHGLVVAPLLRVAYLVAVLVLLYFGGYFWLMGLLQIAPDIDLPRRQVAAFAQTHMTDLVALTIGICLGSLAHVALDALTSPVRWPPRFGRKGRFRR